MKVSNFFDKVSIKPVDLTDINANGLKVLIYGLSGTGKTSFASTASKVEAYSPVLFIDLERGSRPVIEHGDIDNMTVVQPTDFTEFKEVIQAVSEGEHTFKTIVIDTVDKLQEKIVEHWEKDPNTFAKWAAAYEQVLKMVDTLAFKHNLNVICLTHESREVLENIGSLMITPAFEGRKSGIKLPSIFDIIGRLTWEELEDETIVPALTTKGATGIVVKTRFANMPNIIGLPTMGKIERYITEYLDTHTRKEDEEDES